MGSNYVCIVKSNTQITKTQENMEKETKDMILKSAALVFIIATGYVVGNIAYDYAKPYLPAPKA